MKILRFVMIGIMIQAMVGRAQASETKAAHAFEIAVQDLNFMLPEGFALLSVRNRSNHTSLWISNTDRTESFMTVLLYTNFEPGEEVVALHPAYALESCVSSVSQLVLRRYRDVRSSRALVTAAGQRALAQFRGPWDVTLDAVMDVFPQEVWEDVYDGAGDLCAEKRSDLSFFVEVPERQ